MWTLCDALPSPRKTDVEETKKLVQNVSSTFHEMFDLVSYIVVGLSTTLTAVGGESDGHTSVTSRNRRASAIHKLNVEEHTTGIILIFVLSSVACTVALVMDKCIASLPTTNCPRMFAFEARIHARVTC